MQNRETMEELEDRTLASFAARSSKSRGRAYASKPDRLRTEFQRDRDRIIHSLAFRKLEFKTQVHIITAGDYYRTRLTHTLEVAQIARTLARALAVNIDLAEAIALCHDFGHTPFGHAGEEEVRLLMKDHGGFEHNEHGLRTVELLEERNPDYPGLNLTYEVREGIIKHDTDYDKPNANQEWDPGKMATLESQLCDLSDEIAYNNADLDDALKMGLIVQEDLREIPWVWEFFEQARAESRADVPDKFVTYRALSRLYEAHVDDALAHTEARIREAKIQTVDDVRNHRGRLADFSPKFKDTIRPLKQFLLRRVYFHPNTMRNSLKARRMLRRLFEAYLENISLLPWKYQKRIESEGKYRVICDYIAGMTDRYFTDQYKGIFLPDDRI